MFAILRQEVRVVFERDPAAKGVMEVLFCYPGLHAIINHRVAHFFYRHRIFFVARLISHISRFITGIEIHPGAQIGQGLFIDHGSGVVIGETTQIGDNVTLYQGVTLGGTGKEKGKRHPTIGDRVTISAGAKVLGNIKIGNNAKIGGGSVVLRDVPPDCTVVGVPGRIVVKDGEKTDQVDLEHHILPDPVADMFTIMQERIAALEKKIADMEKGEQQDAALQYARLPKGRITNTGTA